MARPGLNYDGNQEFEQSWEQCCKRQDTFRKELSRGGLFRRIEDNWHEAAKCGDFSQLDEVRALLEDNKLTVDNYTKTLATLLKMEEAHDAINQRRFDARNQRLRREFGSIAIHVKGLSNGLPKLVKNDCVVLHNRDKLYEVTVVEDVTDDLIRLSDVSRNYVEFLSRPCDILFVPRGLYSYYDRALKRFDEDSTIRGRLFEDRSVHAELHEPTSGMSPISCGTPEAEERFEALNEHQQKAVFSILEAKCWPKPYILFGPPGTGKTHTLAEAIGQIYVRKPRDKILYCANSNTCVDQMVEKLKKNPLIPLGDVTRLFAGQRPDGIDKSRITLTTNMKSSTLMDDSRFDYVIVDEAGHAHEAESLLPICCLKPTGCLVLAGDPKQLGPVVRCEQAEEFGLARSLLERIFDFRIYQRDEATGKYNSDYITKLLVSYRCDPRVLAISNELFYDGELECANETPEFLLKMLRITNPLQLCYVRGNEETPKYSTSRFNTMEAEKCVDLIMRLYKMGVTPDQIGVISPYKLQSKVIRRKLENELKSSRSFLEERFRNHELVGRAEKKEKSESGDPNTDSIISDLEKSKLDSKEESDLNKQDENVEEEEEVWEDAETGEDWEIRENARVGSNAEAEHKWVKEVRERGDNWLCKIDSVDAYQGDEREIIIISTVRTPGSSRRDSIEKPRRSRPTARNPTRARKEFIDEPHRFNTAISRAKWLVFVVGHKKVLEKLSNWSKFVSSADERKSFLTPVE